MHFKNLLRVAHATRVFPARSLFVPLLNKTSPSSLLLAPGSRLQAPGSRKIKHLLTAVFNRIMTSADGKEPINEQAVANIYAAMRSDINQLYSKITELEMEVSEHSLVIGAIQPLDPSRRCYRMIGGVLVERTIKEVMPAVQRNKEGLEEVISRLNEALEKKKKELLEFEAKYKIRIRKSDGEAKDEGERKDGTAQGVLVGPASS